MKEPITPKVNFADCYVLTNKRTKDFIYAFLNAFLPERTENASTYTVPQLSENPIVTFDTAEPLITYLEKNKRELHAIYWSNIKEEKLRGAMCIFTSDGQLITGLYCETRHPDTAIEKSFLQQLMQFCNSNTGLIEYATPAAEDTAEFLERVYANEQNRK